MVTHKLYEPSVRQVQIFPTNAGTRVGVVVREGPQQSEIRILQWDPDGSDFVGRTLVFMNKELSGMATRVAAPAVVPARAPAAASKQWPAAARLRLLTTTNPNKPGTAKHARWAMVFASDGKTWEEYQDAGGNLETLRNAAKAGVVQIIQPEGGKS